MKVDLSGVDFSPSSYNRDNGTGAAEEVIKALQISGDVNPISVQVAHEDGKHRAADILREHLPGETTFSETPSGSSMNLGYGDVADVLKTVLDAKTQDESEPQDFSKLAKEGERISMSDSVSGMMYKVGEGDPEAMNILKIIMNNDGFMDVLGLDSNHLYGHRIAQLYNDVCGGDMDRFLYHIQMELPNQATGQLSIIGPYCSKLGDEGTKAHFASRKYGKPGSFWAMEHPPTDPNFQYPIKVGTDGLIEEARTTTSARLLDAQELQKLTVRIEAMNPRTRRGFLDSIYAGVVHGKTIFSDESANGFRILLCRYGFQNHAMKLATGSYVS